MHTLFDSHSLVKGVRDNSLVISKRRTKARYLLPLFRQKKSTTLMLKAVLFDIAIFLQQINKYKQA